MANENDPCAIWHMDTIRATTIHKLSKPQLIEIITLISEFNKMSYEAKQELSEAIEEIIKHPQDPTEE